MVSLQLVGRCDQLACNRWVGVWSACNRWVGAVSLQQVGRCGQHACNRWVGVVSLQQVGGCDQPATVR